MVKHPPFPTTTLQALAQLCADLYTGHHVTKGSELSFFLSQSSIPDLFPNDTKWKRLYKNFDAFQKENNTSNNIIKLLKLAYAPARFANHLNVYKESIAKLNRILLMHGYLLKEDGNIHKANPAGNLTEAVKQKQLLKDKLQMRGVHHIILQCAETEISDGNYFHTVLEAMKSVTALIRKKSNNTNDGAKLVDQVFLGDSPQLLINNYQSDTEKSEQRGFANLLKGLYSTFRNPLAHELKTLWHLTEEDALDVLCMISYIHRKLETARRA